MIAQKQEWTTSNENILDYIIIGSGPAGLQMGYFLQKQKQNFLILERGEKAGSFFQKFPRHGQLISSNKVYTGYNDREINLRWDWNSLLNDNDRLLFKNYSQAYFPQSQSLTTYLQDFANYYQLPIDYEVNVVKITKEDNFKIEDSRGKYYICRYLIIATGVSLSYVPSIPGIELAENYTDVTVDPNDFKNEAVLIIGKGNSAFETADNLIATTSKIHLVSPHPIKMAWKTHYVGHLRAVNNNILDTYQLKSQNAILDAMVVNIEKKGEQYAVTFQYSHASGEVEMLLYDRVIICTGFRFDDSIFDDRCKPELVIDNRFPNQTSEWESTNVKDMYFAGTLMQMRDFKKYMSGFIHGFRYNIEALSKILAWKNNQQPLPSYSIKGDPKSVAQAILKRVNVTSALWQQPGFLCDVVAINQFDSQATYYEDLPVDYVHEKMLAQETKFFLITLEYGHREIADPFNVERIERTSQSEAALSTFLHPIIRQYKNHQLISEHHILEDLSAEWLEDEHIFPLINYCQENISAHPSLVA